MVPGLAHDWVPGPRQVPPQLVLAARGREQVHQRRPGLQMRLKRVTDDCVARLARLAVDRAVDDALGGLNPAGDNRPVPACMQPLRTSVA